MMEEDRRIQTDLLITLSARIANVEDSMVGPEPASAHTNPARSQGSGPFSSKGGLHSDTSVTLANNQPTSAAQVREPGHEIPVGGTGGRLQEPWSQDQGQSGLATQTGSERGVGFTPHSSWHPGVDDGAPIRDKRMAYSGAIEAEATATQRHKTYNSN